MANFFADLIKTGARAVLPKELEYKTGLTERPKPMVFPVGEGLTPKGKTQAQIKIKQLAETAPPKQTNFFADLLRDIPRAGASLELKREGRQELVPGESGRILGEVEKFIFGEEPIKIPEKTGEELLAGFGVEPETARKFGGAVGYPLVALSAFPGLPGKGKITGKLLEQLAKKYGKEIGEEIAKKGGRKLAEQAIKEGGESAVAKAGIKIAPARLGAIKEAIPPAKGIIPQELQPLAQEARKKYKIIKQEGIREVKGTPVKIVDGVDTFIHEGTGGWVVSEASTGRYLADSVSKEGAIAKAKFNISNVGEDKFKKLISENQLPESRVVKGEIKKPPVQAVGSSVGVPSKSSVAISLPETRSQELFTSLKASKPESVSEILNVSPSNFTNRSFIQSYYSKVKDISQETLPAYKKMVEEATGLPAEMRVKNFDSFSGKIERYNLNGKNPVEIADNLAGQVIIKSADDAEMVLRNVQNNLKTTEVRNYFETPTDFGYRGINIKVKLPNGMPAELQIHTPESLKIREHIHPLYEKWRNKDLSNLTESQKLEYILDKQKSQKIADDIYAQAVKGVGEVGIPPIKPPVAPVKVSRGIANQAIKFAKENPESSLVAKQFRNPRTKELESGPLLFKRIGESLRNGEININDLPAITKKYNLPAEQVAKLFEDAATYSGRTLQALSRVEQELKKLLPDIQIAKREPTIWEKFKVGYLAVDNFRRSLLVTQLATAARNAISQTGRYTLETFNDGIAGIISKITGKGEGFTPFFEDIAAILRKTNKNNFQRIQNLLKNNPLENARLYNTPVSDVALTNKISNAFNVLNRGQEYFFRNLILDAKLHTAAKVKRVPIEKLGIDDIAKAVDDALDWTFSKSPIRGSFGDAIMRLYRAMPPLTLINPFPRFMSNAVRFLYEKSPLGIMSLFSSKTRAAIAAGDYKTISNAIIGTSMLGGALAIRANSNLAGEKWYEIKIGNKTIDTRPFAPFSTYLLLGEIMANGTEKISGSDWAQAAIGINRVAGTGLALIDLIGNKVDAKNAKNVINGIVSAYVGGFTVPFVTIKDIIGNFRLEERTVKETKEIPIIGGAIGNIPFLQETLPTKYSMFQDKPLQREQTLLRQFTGITIKTKPFIEKELDRMGKDIGDLIPKTGNLKANRIISKQTGVILDKFNDKLKMSEKYKIMGDEEKLEFLKDLISEAKKEAKGEIASDLAGVVYSEIKNAKPDDRKEIILQLKNRGLMTENILDYLLPMIEAQPLRP